MNELKEIAKRLEELADLDYKAGLKRVGIPAERCLGVRHPQLQTFAKKLGQDHQRAIRFFEQDLHEFKFLASLTADPAQLDLETADHWCRQFYSWDLVDQFCTKTFVYTGYAWDLPLRWMPEEAEFVRRTGIVMVVALALKKKNWPDEQFLVCLEWLKPYCNDSRNFVKKATSWALRTLGKRSLFLNEYVRVFAEDLVSINSKTEAWVGRDVLKDIERPSVMYRLKQKSKNHKKQV